MWHELTRAKEAQSAQRKAARAFAIVAVAFVLGFAGWVAGVYQGFWPLGFADRYEQWSSGPENLHGLASTRNGTSFGFETFYFSAGDRLYIDYRATVSTGALVVRIYRTATAGNPTLVSRRVTESGSGRVEATITEDGFYVFSSYAGLDLGARHGGHEVSYTVSWGVVR